MVKRSTIQRQRYAKRVMQSANHALVRKTFAHRVLRILTFGQLLVNALVNALLTGNGLATTEYAHNVILHV